MLNFTGSMANHTDRWYFSEEKIMNPPSIKDGLEHAKELSYRQQCANLIQDIGQRLQVNQLVINTAIVYMHRFYMYHSFAKFHRNAMAPCFVFLAAKVEEMPRKLEHVLKASHACLKKEEPQLDVKSDEYMQLVQDLVNNESVLLQTLGFEVSVEHPNTFVVKCAQLVKASKELAQTAYFLATNSLHLTTFCVQYKPTIVACVCIYVSCLWANYNIPETNGKNWYEFIDPSCTKKQLEDLSSFFITILDKCPTRLKKRLTAGGAVVYKEGKVCLKGETKDKDKTDGSLKSSSSSNSSHKKHNNVDPSKPISKNHLTGMLKPQSHESTPPSRSQYGNSSQNRKHDEKIPDKRSEVPATHKDMKSHKSQEQLRMEQKQKMMTPEQFEEYRKRKKREKLQYYQKKFLQKPQQQQPHSNGKDPTGKQTTPQKSHKPNNNHFESPSKRQKLDMDSRKAHPSPVMQKNILGISSSGSDSEPGANSRNRAMNHKPHQKTNNKLPPPPPPPKVSKPNDIHPVNPPGSNGNARFNGTSIPPQAPPVGSK